jgi:hypothetical protein
MNLTSYGAARQKLLDLGYAPVSATRPDIFDYRAADDIGGILCFPPSAYPLVKDAADRKVVCITITTKDQKLRAAIVSLLNSLGLSGGPTRIAGDGSETRPLRCDEYSPMLRRLGETLPGEIDPCVALDSCTREDPRIGPVSHVLRIDGLWKGADLLSTPRSKLPSVDGGVINKFFGELHSVLPRSPFVMPEISSDTKPSLRELNGPKFVSARCKRDLSNNPNAIQAMGQEAYNELPEWPPEESDAAPAPRSPLAGLTSRIFGGR